MNIVILQDEVIGEVQLEHNNDREVEAYFKILVTETNGNTNAISVTCFGKKAEFALQYISGCDVVVQGSIRVQRTETSVNVDVVATSIDFTYTKTTRRG